MTIVVDASFAVHAATSEEASAAAAVKAMRGDRLSAPPIFWHEVASALRRMRRSRGLPDAAAQAAMRSLADLGIGLEPPTPDLRAVVAASDQHQLSIYDAAYLDLALRTGAGLATRDDALTSAARRAGVRLVEPERV